MTATFLQEPRSRDCHWELTENEICAQILLTSCCNFVAFSLLSFDFFLSILSIWRSMAGYLIQRE